MIFRFFSFSILVCCLGIVFFFESQSSMKGAFRIFHWPAMVLTCIGPMALVCMCSQFRNCWHTLKCVMGPTHKKRQKMHEREARFLQKLNKDFYVEGPDVFENNIPKGLSEFTYKMLDRLATKMPITDVRDFLEIERDQNQVRMVQALTVLSMGVRLTPSVGMLGTILGMVQLLGSLQDPSMIGSHMSLALLTTFYGLFFSLVLWTPMQQKMEQLLDTEQEGFNQAIRWIELLERRKPANYFTDSVSNLPKAEKSSKDAA